MAAALILVVLVLCVVTGLLDVPIAVRMALQLVLILVAALIGSKINRKSKP